MYARSIVGRNSFQWSRLPDSHRHLTGTSRQRCCYAKAAMAIPAGFEPAISTVTRLQELLAPLRDRTGAGSGTRTRRPAPSEGAALTSTELYPRIGIACWPRPSNLHDRNVVLCLF